MYSVIRCEVQFTNDEIKNGQEIYTGVALQKGTVEEIYKGTYDNCCDVLGSASGSIVSIEGHYTVVEYGIRGDKAIMLHHSVIGVTALAKYLNDMGIPAHELTANAYINAGRLVCEDEPDVYMLVQMIKNGTIRAAIDKYQNDWVIYKDFYGAMCAVNEYNQIKSYTEIELQEV